ncbi:hypothetical protein [Hansschlegelia beijingensis]|uniref:Uncharacterized protein n=1 Tax=Hansschlegelia beijingensis TaxID=1133344 RepID=A0A7W6CVD3_9HYPH|nr:hypothetical protein [Hansschlegelia beijingensis]MBB3971815.1 hypothetical protein [Hansschlegelia beijingensis]
MSCERMLAARARRLMGIAAIVALTAFSPAEAPAPEKPDTARRSYDFAPPRPGEMRPNPESGTGSPPKLAQFGPSSASGEQKRQATYPPAAPAASGSPEPDAAGSADAPPSATLPEKPLTSAETALAERISQFGIDAIAGGAAGGDQPEPSARDLLRRSLAVLDAAAPSAERPPASGGAPDALDDLLAAPLACSFHAVSVGQFRGLDYGPGAPSGSSTLLIAASAEDVRRRRAALIDRDGATVARIIRTDRQALLASVNPNGDAATLTLFVSAGRSGGVPSALGRQAMIGATPLLVQSTGVCRPVPKPRAPAHSDR